MPETVQDVIGRIQAKRKEQGYCLAVLALWGQVKDQGIDIDTVRSFGFNSRLLADRGRFRGGEPYIETLNTGATRPRVYNCVWHHDGRQTVLNPMLKAVHDE